MNRNGSKVLLAALALACFVCDGQPVSAQEAAPLGTRREFTNRLTPEQREFIRNVPELQYIRHDVSRAILAKEVYWGEFDFDGDGVPERIVSIEHPSVCDAYSCITAIFKRDSRGWEFTSQADAKHDSLQVLQQSDNGWHRLFDGKGQIHQREGFFYEESSSIRRWPFTRSSRVALDIAASEHPGQIVEFRNQLAASERNFVRTFPALQWMRRITNEALLKRNVYWADVDPERLVMIEHVASCGDKGCSLDIFKLEGGCWIQISSIAGRRGRLSILREADFGWRRIDNGPDDISYMRRCGRYFAVNIYDDETPADWDPCP